jgi:hypothetical protein
MNPKDEMRLLINSQSPHLDAPMRAAARLASVCVPGRVLLFEVCPHFYGVTLLHGEIEVAPDDWLEPAPVELMEQVDALNEGELAALEGQCVMDALADAWGRIEGSGLGVRAYALFHGYGSRVFEFEQRRWLFIDNALAGSAPNSLNLQLVRCATIMQTRRVGRTIVCRSWR